MSEVNKVQVGGDHYLRAYQHWDWVCDMNMPYLLGCATKYVTRWRDKNGIEDLRKAKHYLDKARERGVFLQYANTETVDKFVRQFPDKESVILHFICVGDYHTADELIDELMVKFTQK